MTPADAISMSVDQVAAAMSRTQLQISQHEAAIHSHVAEIEKCEFVIDGLERSQRRLGEQLEALRIGHDRVAEQDVDMFLYAAPTFEGDRNVTG